MWTWATKNGYVEVTSGGRIELPGPDEHTALTERWAEIAAPLAAAEGVPLSWVLAVIYSESGGDPNASNQGSGACGELGCRGLMAIHAGVHTPLVDYVSDPDQWFDAATNLRRGIELLGQSIREGYDLPEAASRYNAGPGSTGLRRDAGSVWGLAENRPAMPWSGYIEKVVRAANWWRARGADEAVSEHRPSSSAKVVLGGLALGAVFGWLGVRHGIHLAARALKR